VLENLGWEIERIWSVDWFRDPKREMQRVMQRLDTLRSLHEPAPAMQSGILEERASPFALDPDVSAPQPVSPGRSKGSLNREETRAQLVALREKIEADCSEADPARSLLRQPMLDELLRKRPTDADEWRTRIPRHLREGTDGEQFKRYGEDVFEILARAG